MRLNFNIIKEGEVIVKMPRELMPDLEVLAKDRGFKNSREFIAQFLKKQLALFYKIDINDNKLKNIR
jgi:hypothetical protein